MSLRSSISPAQRGRRKAGAFTLIEMLMVMSVAVLLMSLAAPSLIDLAPTRKGAIREVKLMLEKAQFSARKDNRVTFVAFTDDSPKDGEAKGRLYAIFREADPEIGTPPREDLTLENMPLVQVTRWERLPQGFIFARGADFEAMPGERFKTVMDSPYRRTFAFGIDDSQRQLTLPYFAFHPKGRIEVPPIVDSSFLNCGIAAGYYEASGRRILTGRRPGVRSEDDFAQGECLSLNRYTGKARLITD
ncbi:MAG: prepilin-type N-terminal cleavage/methylation domain-containing protein [Verrucomicrobiae bacterium]|nr:prepilin-type N-terminal cleavage/methylation domain-containing protein [Verrucomicrobiae bacterium]